jgi:putative sugar O-methyltransferase
MAEHDVTNPGARDPFLTLMLEDMRKAPELYRPTSFWATALDEIVRELDRSGVASFRSHKTALDYYVPVYAHPKNNETLAQALGVLGRVPGLRGVAQVVRAHFDGSARALTDYRVFRAADPVTLPNLSNVTESDYGQPTEHFTFEGRSFSNSMLRYLRALAYLKKTVDVSATRTVLEIGGGYGTLGEALLQCKEQKIFYIDVDIPPVSYVSTHYLQKVFGASRIADYRQTRDLDRIDIAALAAKYDAAVLCPWQLPRVEGKVDLFVNSVSFQEMEPAVVENYAGHVTRLGTDRLLLRNSVGGKAVVEGEGSGAGVVAPIRRDDYVRFFSAFERIAADTVVFGDNADTAYASEVTVFQRKRS